MRILFKNLLRFWFIGLGLLLWAEGVVAMQHEPTATLEVGAKTKVIMYHGKNWQGAQKFDAKTMKKSIEKYIANAQAIAKKRNVEIGVSIDSIQSEFNDFKDLNAVSKEIVKVAGAIEAAAVTGITNLHIVSFKEGGAICAMVSQILAEIGSRTETRERRVAENHESLLHKDLATRSFTREQKAEVCLVSGTMHGYEKYRPGFRLAQHKKCRKLSVLSHMNFNTGEHAVRPYGFNVYFSNILMSTVPDPIHKEGVLNSTYTKSFDAFECSDRHNRVGTGTLKNLTVFIHLIGSDYVMLEGQKVSFNLDNVKVEQYLSHDTDYDLGVDHGKVETDCCGCCATPCQWWAKQSDKYKEFYKSVASVVARVVITVAVAVGTGGTVLLPLV